MVLAFAGVIVATSGSSSDQLVIYSARSHYGEEEPFERFAKDTGTDLRLRGGERPSSTSGSRPRARTPRPTC